MIIIEIIILLVALGILYWIFWQYVYPFFAHGIKPGWLTKKQPNMWADENDHTRWVLLTEQLPVPGQKVDLWVVPKDEEKSFRITHVWRVQDGYDFTYNGDTVTHWTPDVNN